MIAENKIVFMLFFAIAWGVAANVQGRWKAFHWPLIHRIKQARRRAILSFFFFNLFPFFFFGYVMWVLSNRGQTSSSDFFVAIPELVLQAMIPALANFGFYRIWLGLIELNYKLFYETDPENLDEEFRYVEPTVRFGIPDSEPKSPVIYIGPHTGLPNLIWGIIYVIVGFITPWIRF